MTQISAKIVADSINSFGHRLTTLEVIMPRIVLAEFNTHRQFSRNSASSRAIPFKRMVETVQNNPFIPIAWQKDHSGMQGTEYFTSDIETDKLRNIHLDAKESAIDAASFLYSQGVTKQICNRYLEPFALHKVLVTATEWENFFVQRCPQYVLGRWGEEYNKEKDPVFRSRKDYINFVKNPLIQNDINNMSDLQWLSINKSGAEIHIQAVAESIWDAMNESTPKLLNEGEWHLPYIVDEDNEGIASVAGIGVDREVIDWNEAVQLNINAKLKVSTARCARTSYTVVGKDSKQKSYQEDIELHDIKLVPNRHHSPLEHPGRSMDSREYFHYSKSYVVDKLTDNIIEEMSRGITSSSQNEDGTFTIIEYGWCRNFRGWIQYRSLIDGI